MPLKKFLDSLLAKIGLSRTPIKGAPPGSESIYGRETKEPWAAAGPTQAKTADTVVNVWDYLAFKENSQAYHIISVLGYEEWTAMDELRRRIKEVFGVEYENDRSLYPYIKTLVDAGLLETLRTERKQKWRKRSLLFKLTHAAKRSQETAEAVAENR